MPSTKKPPKTPLSDRETKLAQALRANLRRRKVSAPAAKTASATKNESEA
jgi:hypothetical protein